MQKTILKFCAFVFVVFFVPTDLSFLFKSLLHPKAMLTPGAKVSVCPGQSRC